MSTAIKVTNLSKIYRLGEIGTGTISRDLERWYKMKIRRQEDPFLKIGETNVTDSRGVSNVVYSLRDINFEIEQGDAVGIIGKNGAGKSTLLKIISRVTSPTTGKINIKGRVASLLEVGTGFHPELTGRENIYLNGAILGMRKKEITRKLDEIIDFSGVERYIDTPVKRYSSGMYVRLAFAVAAYLEPEILIVDEVLAVGDDEFQKKCLGKMEDVNKADGRTVLFVSHNMGAIQKLCRTSILLENGKNIETGKSKDVIGYYLNQANKSASEYIFSSEGKNEKLAYATKLSIEDLDGVILSEIPIGKPWRVKIYFIVNSQVENLIIALGMINMYGTAIRTSWNIPNNYDNGSYVAVFEEDKIFFAPGRYRMIIGISKGSRESIDYIDNDLWFTISEVIEKQETTVIKNNSGILINQMRMYVEKIN